MGSGGADDWKILVEAVARNGDSLAFSRIFDHFAPRIEAFLIRLGQAPSGAEDIAQEVMSVLWRKAHLYDPAQASVSTWIYRVARNRHIDSLRRKTAGSIDPRAPELLEMADPAAGADEILAANDDAVRIRAAIARLPDEQQALIRLAFYEGLSHVEIAEQTGQPLGTVKSRIRLAFSKIRRDIEAAGAGP